VFVQALFRHAAPQGVVSLRAFVEGEETSFRISPTPLSGGLNFLVDVAVDDARRAAQAPKAVVFAPPVATFRALNGAKVEDLAEGIALSVECDSAPAAARAKLTKLLGKPTVIVASGGEWPNPITGNPEKKLHLHWRLTVPTRNTAEHAQLREARELATKLADGDRSNVSIVHPLRWPGSWHRKNPEKPRLECILDSSPDAEIELGAALAKLREACPQPDRKPSPRSGRRVPLEDVEAALEIIPNPDLNYPDWVRIGMAAFAASDGEAFAAFDKWSAKSSAKYGGTRKAWDAWVRNPPVRISFGTLFFEARKADPGWRPPSWEAIANPFGEDGMAQVFAERHATSMRFVPMWGRWLLWSGTTWRPDERLEAFTAARVVCRDTAKLAKENGASRLSSAKTVAAVVTMAKADPLLAAAPAEWDADDWTFITTKEN
jgi:hypothetical protein